MMRLMSLVLMGAFLATPHQVFANVVGSDYEIFNPNSDGLDFMTVESAATLKKGQFNLGVVFDVALNSLPNVVAAGTKEDSTVRHGISDYRDLLFIGHFSLGMGLMDGWSIGVSFPTVIRQVVESGEHPTHVVDNNVEGLLEVRANTKIRFLGNDNQGMAVIARLNYNVQDPNPFLGEDPNLMFSTELVANANVSDWMSFALNAGYQWRESGGQIAGNNIQPTNNMIVGSVALAFHMTDSTSLLTEFYGAGTTTDTDSLTDRVQSPFEGLIGMKHDCGHGNYQYGIVTELSHGINTADYRLYAAMNWAFGGVKAAPAYVPPPPPKPMPMPMPKPKPMPAPKAQPAKTITVNNINFASGSAKIGLDSVTQKEIQKVVKALKMKPFTSVEIAGHTDSSGSDALNLRLSQKRANAIRAELIKRGGFDAKKLKAVGYGETQPIADNTTTAGKKKNRRVEFKIFD